MVARSRTAVFICSLLLTPTICLAKKARRMSGLGGGGRGANVAAGSSVVVHGKDSLAECPCRPEDNLPTCVNLATDLWMQGEMDAAMVCMDLALRNKHGNKQSRDAAKQNLQLLYGLRIRSDAMRFYHGYEAKDDWIFPPLGTSKGFKDRSIRLYENALPAEFCDFLVRIFERDTHLQYPGNVLGKGISKGKKDMEIDISDPTSGEWADVDWYLVQKTTKYLGLYEMERSNRNLANTGPFGDEGYRMKRYYNMSEAVGGKEFHTWHSDGGSATSCYRALAIVFYLNDVEEGGETVFLTEGINIKPTKGSALIWPTGFNYIHAGLPPISGPKYIITNFLRYTAPRIFNTLDIPPPPSLQDTSSYVGGDDRGRSLPSGGRMSKPAQPAPRAATGAGAGASGPGVTGDGIHQVGGGNKKKKRRRRRKKRIPEATCSEGTCEL